MQRVQPVLLMILLLALSAPAAAESESHEEFPFHHAFVFLGGATEQRDNESGFAVGLEYAYRFAEQWGVGAIIEAVGQETVRDVVALIPVGFHIRRLRLVAAPGVEFGHDHDEFLVRLGVGYEFSTPFGLLIVPEANIDGLLKSRPTFVYGCSFGLQF